MTLSTTIGAIGDARAETAARFPGAQPYPRKPGDPRDPQPQLLGVAA